MLELTARDPKESGRDYALRTLKDNIISLHLEPGSMVSESELAQQMGLSRTPVREALIELARVKIVEVVPQRGSRIALIDYDQVDEGSFLRDTLETAVAAKCCKEDISAYMPALEENMKMQELFQQNDMYEKLMGLDDSFHRTLFQVVNLTQTYELMHSMTVHMDRLRMISMYNNTWPKTVAEHQLIFAAVQARDAEAAAKAMHEHVTRYRIDKAAICEKYPQYLKP